MDPRFFRKYADLIAESEDYHDTDAMSRLMSNMDRAGIDYSEDEMIDAKFLSDGTIGVVAYDMTGSHEYLVTREEKPGAGDFPGSPEFSSNDYSEAMQYFDNMK